MNYYDSIAKGYNELYLDEQYRKFFNVKKLFPKKGLILDLGCGTGFITERLKNAVGVDYSIEMLKQCKNELRIVCANIEKLPFKDKTFDAVFSLTVLQDVRDAEAAISEIKRVLKPKGKIILSVLNKGRVEEIRYLLNQYFENLKEEENYNDVVFFKQ